MYHDPISTIFTPFFSLFRSGYFFLDHPVDELFMSLFRGKWNQVTLKWSIGLKKSGQKQFLNKIFPNLEGYCKFRDHFLAKNACFFEEIVDFQHENMVKTH